MKSRTLLDLPASSPPTEDFSQVSPFPAFLPLLLTSELVQMHLSAFHLCPNGPGKAHGRAWAEKQLSVISDRYKDKLVDEAK